MENNKEKVLETLRNLGTLAGEIGCTQAELAIAWAVKNPDVSTCLLGASRPEQLDSSLKGLEVANQLTPEILQRIEDTLGNRPEPSMKWRTFSLNPPRR